MKHSSVFNFIIQTKGKYPWQKNFILFRYYILSFVNISFSGCVLSQLK
jgi:hypothetical protein